MQSAGEPADFAARPVCDAPATCPPRHPGRFPDSRFLRARDAAPLPCSPAAVFEPLPHDEGNRLWFWLYLYNNVCMNWASAIPQTELADRGRRKNRLASCHAKRLQHLPYQWSLDRTFSLFIFQVSASTCHRMCRLKVFHIVFVKRDKRWHAAPLPACFEVWKGRGSSSQFLSSFLSVSEMHRRWGILEKRSGRGCHW